MSYIRIPASEYNFLYSYTSSHAA